MKHHFKLGEPFYLNVVKFQNDERWFPVWDYKYVGDKSKPQAVALRNEFLRVLDGIKSAAGWQDKDLRTVKITYYELPYPLGRKKIVKK